MATKTVVYTSSSRLSCWSLTNPGVILCLSDSSLIAPQECLGGGGDVPFDFTTIEATLTRSYKSGGCCNNPSYTYVFSYDDAQLADPETALLASQIVGVFCEGCLTTWIEEKVGNEVVLLDNGDGTLTLTTQHGCSYTFNGSFP